MGPVTGTFKVIIEGEVFDNGQCELLVIGQPGLGANNCIVDAQVIDSRWYKRDVEGMWQAIRLWYLVEVRGID